MQRAQRGSSTATPTASDATLFVTDFIAWRVSAAKTTLSARLPKELVGT
jgi:hypothetical protein